MVEKGEALVRVRSIFDRLPPQGRKNVSFSSFLCAKAKGQLVMH